MDRFTWNTSFINDLVLKIEFFKNVFSPIVDQNPAICSRELKFTSFDIELHTKRLSDWRKRKNDLFDSCRIVVEYRFYLLRKKSFFSCQIYKMRIPLNISRHLTPNLMYAFNTTSVSQFVLNLIPCEINKSFNSL